MLQSLMNCYRRCCKRQNDNDHEEKLNVQSEEVPEREKTLDINRLVMRPTNVCTLCGIKNNKCKELNFGRLVGWIYCDNCKKDGTLKKAIFHFMKTELSMPYSWLILVNNKFLQPDYYSKEKELNKYPMRYLHFFRKSREHTDKPIHTARIFFAKDSLTFRYDTDSKKLMVMSDFSDTKTQEPTMRDVTLANLMYHNPGLYDEIISTKNILPKTDIIIPYSEVPSEVKQLIEDTHLEALKAKSSSDFNY